MGDEGTQRLTGAQIIAQELRRRGVPYAFGIPGHGCWNITDALLDHAPAIRVVQVMHEQSAVHAADGYFRATGRPAMAFTSIGPGQMNCVVGIATAYVDSSAVLLVTGSTHTYMRGHGVLQEIERRHAADNPRVFEPIVKEWWQPSRVDELPAILRRAWNQMLSGRPGPVLLDLPMDVQAASCEIVVASPDPLPIPSQPRPDPEDIERAAELLLRAERPVIVAGGGVILSEASQALTAVAERLGAAVVTTWQGKGAIDETHELNAWGVGDTASTCGNELAASADVILAVGCRFTDWSSSSWRRGITYAIPPAKLIHLDIDAREIGKNYPVACGLFGDARAGLEDILAALGPAPRYRWYVDTPYYQDIQSRKMAWEEVKARKARSDSLPMTQARAIAEVQAAVGNAAVVVTGAGWPQAIVRQNWITREPRAHITSGGFSTMGFTVPAAIGAKLARPDRQVLGIAGDGDFLQTMQELATAALLELPVVFIVLDNSGWMSIKAGQLRNFGRAAATDFLKRDGSLYSPDYAAIAAAFGLHSEQARTPEEVPTAVKRSIESGRPALVAITVSREPEHGLDKTGWWDVPVPERYTEQHAAHAQGRAEEQHQWW